MTQRCDRRIAGNDESSILLTSWNCSCSCYTRLSYSVKIVQFVSRARNKWTIVEHHWRNYRNIKRPHLISYPDLLSTRLDPTWIGIGSRQREIAGLCFLSWFGLVKKHQAAILSKERKIPSGDFRVEELWIFDSVGSYLFISRSVSQWYGHPSVLGILIPKIVAI